jgi:glycerol uptake facilitator-like aquaporin
MLAPVSGGHFNPAVTWGLAITGKVTAVRAVFYTGAQLTGACCGTLMARSLARRDTAFRLFAYSTLVVDTRKLLFLQPPYTNTLAVSSILTVS